MSHKRIGETLRNLDSLKISIENMRQEIKEIEEEEATLGSIDYAKDKICQSYKISSQTENEAISNVDKIALLRAKIKATESKVERIDRALIVLNETERYIIQQSSIERKPYYTFLHKLHMGERTAQRIKQTALREIERALNGENGGK